MGDEESENEIRSFVIPSGGIDRLDTWLVGECPGFSRARIQGLMKADRLTVNGKTVRRAIEKVKPGDTVELAIPPPVPAIPQPEAIPFEVVFEGDDILVLNKPAGLVVHPAPGHLTGTLVNAVLHHCPKLAGIGGVARPGIVHRLDQDTSGLMVIAKSDRAMVSLTKQFQSHDTIEKVYLTLVHGVPQPPEGTVKTLIGRSPANRKKMAVLEKNGKEAVTHYKVLKRLGPVSLVECRIETGRTHQIRVHMAHLGCPVIGDATYGRPAADKQLTPVPARQMLHAAHLAFRSPTDGKPLAFDIPPPPDFAAFL